jgi:hypothetical protein
MHVATHMNEARRMESSAIMQFSSVACVPIIHEYSKVGVGGRVDGGVTTGGVVGAGVATGVGAGVDAGAAVGGTVGATVAGIGAGVGAIGVGVTGGTTTH